jgi:hypothetical protein
MSEEINQHQSASKPKEMNNLSELSGSLKTLSYPSLCTPSISKSSNARGLTVIKNVSQPMSKENKQAPPFFPR